MQNLIANWQAPQNICALTTTRLGGVSLGAYASNNFGTHVEDNFANVMQNRKNLSKNLNLPGEPFWLEQTHTNICVNVTTRNASPNADASITRNKQIPLAILTADCVPIVICNQQGDEIAAIHAGWKGLVSGIIENTVRQFTSPAADYLAWIGPAICQNCYATGSDVQNQFINKYIFLKEAFNERNEKIYANLPKIANLILNNLGISKVYLANTCTYEENDKYYSYRRQAITGRIATIIWFQE